jgi:hypothetical protein
MLSTTSKKKKTKIEQVLSRKPGKTWWHYFLPNSIGTHFSLEKSHGKGLQPNPPRKAQSVNNNNSYY